MAIGISTAGVDTAGSERPLPIPGLPARFGVRDYDVVPKTNRLIVMRIDDPPATPNTAIADFRIGVNWFEELRQRVVAAP